MRRPIVAGNWKMHGTRADNARLIEELLGGHPDRAAAECLVFPPFVYLQEVGRLVRDTPIGLGAQSVCAEAQGAFTGEVSAGMLKDVGCSHVLVGHSERRWIYHEDDQLVARKFAAAQSKSLVPILCVGEHLSDRENGRTEEIVSRQLDAVIDLCGVAALETGVIAYEPIWAIGTGRTATPEQAQAVHAFIRERIGERDAKIAKATRVLYGGSVKASNAAELFAQPDVDGGLIGGASLNAEEFLAILAACGSR
jgi:triosephosphate isomerase